MSEIGDPTGGIVVIAACMVPVGIVGISSYFAHKRLELVHKERLAAIEKGIMPSGDLPDPEKEDREERERLKSPPNYLHRGLFWFCPGAGLVAFSLMFLAEISAAIRLPILGASIACAGVGAAYIVIHVVETERARAGLQ